jgi:hypothetical protein
VRNFTGGFLESLRRDSSRLPTGRTDSPPQAKACPTSGS